MVTANNACIRFEKKLIMSESNVEKYIRARRRRAPSPKCLFGAPSEAETDEFLSQQDTQQREENQKVLEKYDLSNVPKDLLEGIAEEAGATSSACGTSEGVKFQPRIITDEDPPPTKNVFSPIQKMGSASSTTSSSSVHHSDQDPDTGNSSKFFGKSSPGAVPKRKRGKVLSRHPSYHMIKSGP